MTWSSLDPRSATRRAATALSLGLLLAACSGSPGASPTAEAPSAAATALGSLQVQAKIPVKDAFDIAAAFGSIWVAANNRGVVVRIDPATNAVLATIQVSTFVSSLAPTDDGLWVIDGDAKSVRRIDPTTNELSDDAIAIGDDGGALQFAQGALWQSGHGAAQRIDLKARTTEKFALPACDDCYLVILGEAGYAIGTGRISRIDLTTHQALATNTTDVAGPVVALGASGLWAGAAKGGVALLDPRALTVRQTFSAPSATANGATYSLGTAGENGGIVSDDAGAWVRFSAPVLGRVAAADGHVDLYGPYPPSDVTASGFVVADGSIWITNTGGAPGSDETGSVWRLALPTP